MDYSSIIFIATLAIGFLFLRWLIAPIPQNQEYDINPTAPNTSTSTSRNTSTSQRRNRRPVNDSMIEVVQSIAPHLSREQIRYDLENTGSVEQTVERFMELGTLPFPPGHTPVPEPAPVQQPETGSNSTAVSSTAGKPVNLLEKFDVDVNSEYEGQTLLQRKQQMIVNARKRLEKQLRNEIDL
ncbi:Coupling of ubiquitin conjugation to ER degradation protein 1 [Spathaspora sp. JA1]|nr:Coupling of ubiquitin conjugation to ER degradation protein 1 [Spathaspora sp. JA1]